MDKNKKGIFVITIMVFASAFIMCSCTVSTSEKQDSNQPETVIVKETILVTDTPAQETETEDTAEQTEALTETPTEEPTEAATDKKGFTTADILKKAKEVAEKQYWILYYCDNELRMQSFNALEGFTVTLRSDQHLKCDRLVGDVTLYYWDEAKSNFSITKTSAYGDWSCNDIIGGNVDVIDEENDKTISAKTE